MALYESQNWIAQEKQKQLEPKHGYGMRGQSRLGLKNL
jgi:hypothetical protein